MKQKPSNNSVRLENNTFMGNHVNIAGGDIIQNNITMQDFENLITEIKSVLNAINLDVSDKEDAEASLEIAQKQARKENPRGNVIVGSLTTAMDLIIHAGGTAKAIEDISALLQKAISYAETIF